MITQSINLRLDKSNSRSKSIQSTKSTSTRLPRLSMIVSVAFIVASCIPLLADAQVDLVRALPTVDKENARPAEERIDRPTRPNIVVIMADDLGWRDLHCYGNELLDTPNLDQLAADGMLFTDAYAAAPVCSPTRAAMMTGQSPARIRLTNHAPGNADRFSLKDSDLQEADGVRNLQLSYTTIAERLSESGYDTAHVGKWHLSYVTRNDVSIAEPQLRPEHQGFDLNIGGCARGGPPSYFAPYRIPALKDGAEGEYLPERLADEAIKFLRQERDDKPFFLSYWPYSVHYPMQAREDLIEKYRKRKGPGIKNPTYAAMIEAMDTELGRFLEALDEEGLRENTLVIFKSDNGGYDGDNRPLRGMKGMLFEGGIRIPWIVRWPGKIQPGSVCNTPIISTDCFPTLLEAAGLDPEPNQPLDGQSLTPLLKQTSEFERDFIAFHYPNYAFHKKNKLGSAIRQGDFKLIKRYEDNSLELYNLQQDISEQNNLAAQQPDLAKQMSEKLENWLESNHAEYPTRKSNE